MPDLDQRPLARSAPLGASTAVAPSPEMEVEELYGNAFMSSILTGEVCEDPLVSMAEEPGVCEDPSLMTPVEEPGVCEAPPSALPQYDVVPDDFVGPLGPGQLRQSEADRRHALTPPDAEQRAQADPTYAQRLIIAQELIKTGGRGDLTDGQLVVGQLVDMPLEALQALQQKGTRVVACRDSVTDYLTDLRGVQPRGWPPGSTWDSVPGLNNPATNEVVIATRGHGTEEGAHVPRTGDGHGSYNLVIHETMHAVDMNNKGPGETNRSDSAAFQAARDADAAVMNNGYLAQAGEAGRQETYAEIAARYYAGDPTLQAEMPNLYAYFASNPLAAERAATPTPTPTPAPAPKSP